MIGGDDECNVKLSVLILIVEARMCHMLSRLSMRTSTFSIPQSCQSCQVHQSYRICQILAVALYQRDSIVSCRIENGSINCVSKVLKSALALMQEIRLVYVTNVPTIHTLFTRLAQQ